MKYCMRYMDTFRYKHSLEEVIYEPSEKNEELLRAELERVNACAKEKITINLTSDNYLDIDFLHTLRKLLDENKMYKEKVRFSVNYYDMLYTHEDHKAHFDGYKFFYANPVTDWEILHELKKRGPAAMRIASQLGFEIDRVAENLHDAEIEVRVCPNSTSSNSTETDSLIQFWIRPEDVPYYEDYVDVMELYTPNNQNASIIFKAYAIDQKWFGLYEEIIYGLDNDIDGRFTIPTFGEQRTRCGRRCLKDGRCQTCYVITNLGRSFETKQVFVNTN